MLCDLQHSYVWANHSVMALERLWIISTFFALFTALLLYGYMKPEDTASFDVPTVLAGLLAVEAEAVVRSGAQVAIGFGGCLDRLGNSINVLNQLGATPPINSENINELNNLEELEKAFGYYFQHGASAG